MKQSATLGHLSPIDTPECRQLLTEGTVGRVGWQSAEGLVVLPVAYGVHTDGRLGFRVGAGSVLAELARPTSAVFEVDDLDMDTATGWSVLARGRTRAWQGEFPAGLCRPWAPGERGLAIEFVPDTCSGRSVSTDEFH